MIVKVSRIKFHKFLGIGPVIDIEVKKYLNRNTGNKYLDGIILNVIYEFRFIDGRRYIYKNIYKKSKLDNVIEELTDMVKPIKDFIDLIIISIEKE